MKKSKRWIALLLALLLCASLCGCQELEDMRANHAVWQEDGTILWNGVVYRELADVPEEYQHVVDGMIFVTEADVPVLLSQEFGTNWTVDTERGLLHSWNHNGQETFFCREDRYEEMAEYFQKYFDKELVMDTYFYHSWPVSHGQQTEETYYLSDSEKTAVNTLLNGSEFVVLKDQDEFFGSFEDDEFCVTLGRCDEKFLFVEHYVVEIVSKREGFYLFLDGRLATVPAEYNDVFRNNVADFYENEVAPYISEY